jgi:hypothetical protein
LNIRLRVGLRRGETLADPPPAWRSDMKAMIAFAPGGGSRGETFSRLRRILRPLCPELDRPATHSRAAKASARNWWVSA